MRVYSTNEPSHEPREIGDEWFSPEGWYPPFQKVWNGAGWEEIKTEEKSDE
jgi:hypothetical protein